MPKMLTSDNLSTWLSTRYASRNKNKQHGSGFEDNNKIRQARKKSSSGRAQTMIDSEGYLEWLTPKRAKIMEYNANGNSISTNHALKAFNDTGNLFTYIPVLINV